MTFSLFSSLVVAFSIATSYATQIVKKLLDDHKKKYASNLVVAIVAIVIGVLGTIAAYVLLGLQFTVANIVCIILMPVAVCFGAMFGYDKVVQFIEQCKLIKR